MQVQETARQNHAVKWQTLPQQYLQAIKPKNAIDVLRSSSQSLIRMTNESGEMPVKALLSLLIIETVDYFNVGKTMSAQQIGQTIDLILEDYSVYKPDFFVLCFNRAKKGLYGKTWDRIDGQIIFEWLSQFEYEYLSDIEQERINEKKRIEQDVTPTVVPMIDDPKNAPVPMPDYVKETLLDMTKNKIMPVKQVQRTKEQLIVDGYITDFNEIRKANFDPGGKSFIFFHGIPGRAMDINEYLEHRICGGSKVPQYPFVKPVQPWRT
jgi:hypothetical protein